MNISNWVSIWIRLQALYSGPRWSFQSKFRNRYRLETQSNSAYNSLCQHSVNWVVLSHTWPHIHPWVFKFLGSLKNHSLPVVQHGQKKKKNKFLLKSQLFTKHQDEIGNKMEAAFCKSEISLQVHMKWFAYSSKCKYMAEACKQRTEEMQQCFTHSNKSNFS